MSLFDMPADMTSEASVTVEPTVDNKAPEISTTEQPIKQDVSNWFDSFQDDNHRSLVKTKGWKTSEDAVKSYMHLEKMFGQDRAGRTLTLPKDESDEETFNTIYDKLGRPQDEKEYNIHEFYKDEPGYNEDIVNQFQKEFKSAGLNKKQASHLANSYSKIYGEFVEKQINEFNKQAETYKQTDHFKSNQADAQKGFKMMGVRQDEFHIVQNKLMEVLGPERTIDIFATLGRRGKESPYINNDENMSMLDMDSKTAEERIEKLKHDPLFLNRYQNNDKVAMDEMRELIKIVTGTK